MIVKYAHDTAPQCKIGNMFNLHHLYPETPSPRDAFRAQGIPFLADSVTNQQFPILTKAQQARLAEKYAYSYWTAVDEDRDAVRFCTSWATTEENLAALIGDIAALR